MQKTNSKYKTYAFIGTIAFHVILLLILIILGFTPSPPPYPDPDGILINFGDENPGSGTVEPTKQQTASATQPETKPENLTQDFEDAPSLKEIKKTTKKIKKQPKEKTEQKTKEETKTEEAKINKEALFPSNIKTASSSQGTSQGSGNEGSKEGDPMGLGNQNLGRGTHGISYSLGGRKAIRLIAPKYPNKNVEGTVVVKIKVDNTGTVISAEVDMERSTTADPELQRSAINAAYKTKFTKSSDLIEQYGTITFQFKLR